MTTSLHIAAFAALLALAAPATGTAAPCDGVDRTLTPAQATTLAHEIAPQLAVTSLDVLQSFRDGAWSILYVDSHVADEAFLFFSGDPASHRYVTLWSGAATRDEGPAIRHWVLANAPGVPVRLAGCFAWHVTQDRDK